ncbi:MAG: PilZ domain-containing protein [gamma proteobacterium symbiont of Taylorina sp.]|nr:PilZ domain-containing protein [gamma proteobacterium symbiont of Taylorina sp.]
MNKNSQIDERRQYYRIDDDIIFNYRIIQEGNIVPEQDKKVTAAFEMIELFGQMNLQMRVTLGRISERSADIASYLKSLDSKIELLAEMNLFKDDQSILHARQKINLGAGGLSFSTDESLKRGMLLAIDMILSTDLTCLHLTGQVVKVSNEKNNDCPYNISIAFSDITDPEEDKIIKHIMHLQSEQLRADRVEN